MPPALHHQTTWIKVQAEHSQDTFFSLLGVPDSCSYTQCPLVVVSHPRGQTPERLFKSTSFEVLAKAFLKANFVVLLSSDGGLNTWGSPTGFQQVVSDHHYAVQHFNWNGRTYALGLSMGGLMALRSSLPESPYLVSGVALIDAWTNLPLAWKASPAREAEMQAAYASQSAPTDDQLIHLPWNRSIPMFVAASPDDKVVPWKMNSEQIYLHAEKHYSEFVTLSGPHLGGNRFTPQMAERLLLFFNELELRARLLESAELPL